MNRFCLCCRTRHYTVFNVDSSDVDTNARVSKRDSSDVTALRVSTATRLSPPPPNESDAKSPRRSVSDVTSSTKKMRRSKLVGSRLSRMSTDDSEVGLNFARVSLDLMQVRGVTWRVRLAIVCSLLIRSKHLLVDVCTT